MGDGGGRVELERHFAAIADAVASGRLAVYVGPDIHLCGRPAGATWRVCGHAPTDDELAKELRDSFDLAPERNTLVEVVDAVRAYGRARELDAHLREIFGRDFAPTPAHRLLAALPRAARRGGATRYPVIFSGCSDRVLETTFAAAGEPFTVVGVPPAGAAQDLEARTTIVTVPGDVDAIDVLSRYDVETLLPRTVSEAAATSHLLLLTSPPPLPLRLVLARWSRSAPRPPSWAVVAAPSALDRELLGARGFEVVASPLDDYVAGLAQYLAA